jgi:hypothetical protein
MKKDHKNISCVCVNWIELTVLCLSVYSGLFVKSHIKCLDERFPFHEVFLDLGFRFVVFQRISM